jgi:hypothetical protein
VSDTDFRHPGESRDLNTRKLVSDTDFSKEGAKPGENWCLTPIFSDGLNPSSPLDGNPLLPGRAFAPSRLPWNQGAETAERHSTRRAEGKAAAGTGACSAFSSATWTDYFLR